MWGYRTTDRLMKLESDIATSYSLLNDPKPEGIKAEKASGGAVKAFNVDLNITIDLAKIPVDLAVLWILTRIAVKSRSKIKVNGQLLPPDEAGAIKMITDAIEEEQQKNRKSN
jgi:hypothetical protein